MVNSEFLRAFAFGTAVAAALFCGPAHATPLTSSEILDQFNLVTFGNLDSSSEVEGRMLVGGDLTGSSSTYFTRPGEVSTSGYAAVTVGGTVSGGYKNINGGGDAVVGGNVQNMNMNGGTAFIGGSVTGNVNGTRQVGVPVEIPDFRATLTGFSENLGTLSTNSAPTLTGNRATFDAAPDTDGFAVFSITDGASFFSSIGEIDFALNGADTLIINVGGLSMTIAENFLGGIGTSIASSVIWNFYEATDLVFAAEFYGTILAPHASVTNFNSLNGSVVVDSFTQRGEVHLPTFAGEVPPFDPENPQKIPAPGTLMLVLTGGLALAALRRQSRGAAVRP